MEDKPNAGAADLRKQIAILQKDEKHLEWLLSATFARAEVKAKATLDLRAIVETLKRLSAELSHLELGNGDDLADGSFARIDLKL